MTASALPRRPPVAAARAPAPTIRGAGLLTGWGEGVGVLGGARPGPPAALVTTPTPVLAGERFRRSTRECLLGAAAVRAAAQDAGLEPDALAGGRTGLLYASATAYASANRAFLEDETCTTLHFPYTAPSAVPGEVSIALGVRGPYVNLMGGGPAALQALWYAARWLDRGLVDRVIVLAVEAVHEVWDLFGRARRLYRRPVMEGAACLLLEPGPGQPLAWASAAAWGGRAAAVVEPVLDAVLAAGTPRFVSAGARGVAVSRAEAAALARRGATPARLQAPGEPLACGPLVALMQARAGGEAGACLVTATWRNDYGAMLWPV